MSDQLSRILQRALDDDAIEVQSSRSLGGGCINNAQKVVLGDGRVFFVKTNNRSMRSMFDAEAIGLAAIKETQSIRVPAPIHSGELSDRSFLVLEWIESCRPSRQSSIRLGRELADLHRYESQSRFGFSIDNFIGATPQKNDWCDDWVTFLISNRFEPQFSLVAERGFQFQSDRFFRRLENLISKDTKPSLIHGDLWSGNFMIGTGECPYLIDPAPYWGNREAEFGILTMFGGFDSYFFSAYEEAYPFEDGFDDRLPIYQLYHYLNHLNLFGDSYLGSCQTILSRLA